jgi:DNA-binding NtrC family response regulator
VQKLTGVDELGPLASVLPALRAHPWSGNVRELRNVVEAAIVMGATSAEANHPPRSPAPRAAPPRTSMQYRDARAAALHRFEAEYPRDLIERTGGNASEAARLARMDRPYLLTLLQDVENRLQASPTHCELTWRPARRLRSRE